MKKVICEVCGATYPDEANRCPICGCVRNSVPVVNVSQTQINPEDSGVRYANGGKYRKSNVRKRKSRSGMKGIPKEYVKYIAAGVGLFLMFALLLGLIIKSCTNGGGVEIDIPNITPTTAPTTEPLPTGRPCIAIDLSNTELILSEAGATHKLTAFPDPEDTTEKLSFTTSNPNVATVDDVGTITAVSNGYAMITVRCGSVVAICNVTVQIPEPTEPPLEYKINQTDVTLTIGKAGYDRFSLYLRDQYGEKAEVEWVASKEGVVKIMGNTIKAVSKGTIKVSATFEGKTYTCIVRVTK